MQTHYTLLNKPVSTIGIATMQLYEETTRRKLEYNQAKFAEEPGVNCRTTRRKLEYNQA